MDERAVIEEFTRRRRQVTGLALILGGFAGLALVLLHFDMASRVATATVILGSSVFAVIVNLRLWRCPSCQGHLGRLYLGLKQPRFCPQCGIRLVDDAS